MPPPRALFVKLSSLGDVVHLLPALTDLRRRRPDLALDWAVEEAYAPLVRLHPAVARVIAIGLRRLRTRPLSREAWSAMPRQRRALREVRYDWIVDAQGLIKSALVARQALGPVFGLDRRSAREGAAARLYDQAFAVPRNLHAVERNRRLVGAVFGYRPEGVPDYGLAAPVEPPAWAPRQGYVVALHAASRREKRWPDDRWIALAQRLADEGLATVFPGGTAAERQDAERLARAVPGGVLAPALDLQEAAALLAHARAVVGVDTGLTHLAVALGTPAVGLYVATRPGLTGLAGGARAVNLGGPRMAPTAEDVARVLFGSAPA